MCDNCLELQSTKHLPGRHDQKKHAGSRSSAYIDAYTTIEELNDALMLNLTEDEMHEIARTSDETVDLYGAPASDDDPLVLEYTMYPFAYQGAFDDEPIEKGKELQSRIIGSELQRDEVLYRGVNGEGYIRNLLKEAAGGNLVLEDHFTSTSRSKGVAAIFASNAEILVEDQPQSLMMKIHASKGLPGLFVDAPASEILLPANAKFEVLSAGSDMVELRYVGI